MKLTNNRLALFLVIGFTAVSLLCIGAIAFNALRSPSGAAVEFDDCDAEDRRNRERECGISGRKTTAPVKPAPAKTTKPVNTNTKPAGTNTRKANG